MPIPQYYEDFDQANSYLRLVLSVIVKHKIPPNLINFSLIYEYITGGNEKLIEEIKNLLSSGYNKEKAIDLYISYIWDEEKRTHDLLNRGLTDHFNDSLRSVTKAHSDTSKSSRKLENHSQTLDSHVLPESLKNIVKNIVIETNNALKTTKKFEHDLAFQQKELELLKEELAYTKILAATDPLTKLNNRRSFENHIHQHIKDVSKSPKPLCMIMLDIDFFKKFNDEYGHSIGDSVICFIANTITKNIKQQDFAARIGGEEYAILLPNTQPEKAKLFADKIRKVIEKSVLKVPSTQKKLEQITVSLGVTVYKQGETISKFFDRTDRALYVSKHNGRNQVSSL